MHNDQVLVWLLPVRDLGLFDKQPLWCQLLHVGVTRSFLLGVAFLAEGTLLCFCTRCPDHCPTKLVCLCQLCGQGALKVRWKAKTGRAQSRRHWAARRFGYALDTALSGSKRLLRRIAQAVLQDWLRNPERCDYIEACPSCELHRSMPKL